MELELRWDHCGGSPRVVQIYPALNELLGDTAQRTPPPAIPAATGTLPLSLDCVPLSPSLLALLASAENHDGFFISPQPSGPPVSSPRNFSPLSIMKFSMNRFKSLALNSKLEL